MIGDLEVNGNVDVSGNIHSANKIIANGAVNGFDVCAVGGKCLNSLKVYVDTNNCSVINEPNLQDKGCPSDKPVLNRVGSVCSEGTCPSDTNAGYCCPIKIRWQ